MPINSRLEAIPSAPIRNPKSGGLGAQQKPPQIGPFPSEHLIQSHVCATSEETVPVHNTLPNQAETCDSVLARPRNICSASLSIGFILPQYVIRAEVRILPLEPFVFDHYSLPQGRREQLKETQQKKLDAHQPHSRHLSDRCCSDRTQLAACDRSFGVSIASTMKRILCVWKSLLHSSATSASFQSSLVEPRCCRRARILLTLFSLPFLLAVDKNLPMNRAYRFGRYHANRMRRFADSVNCVVRGLNSSLAVREMVSGLSLR